MAFESVDASEERGKGWQKPYSAMDPEEQALYVKDQKKVEALLSFILDLTPGAFSLSERIVIVAFDSTTYSIHPKKLGSTPIKSDDQLLIYDIIFKRAYFLAEQFDITEFSALKACCEDYFGHDLEWLQVEHENYSKLTSAMSKQSAALKEPPTFASFIEDDEVQKEHDKDEIRKKIQSLLNMADLLNFFYKSLNKIKELEEALHEAVEEESQENADERKERLKFKELLKKAIKEELMKEELLVEEVKRRQPGGADF